MRRYLIKPDETADFVAAINAGFEPRPRAWGQFLLADGDEFKPVSGLPELPEPDRNLIRLQAIDARIVEVGMPRRNGRKVAEICDARYPLRIVVDNNQILRPGERLRIKGSGYSLVDIIVEEATAGIASGTAKVLEVNCGKPNPDDVPSDGLLLTTGAYDEAASNRDVAEAQHQHEREASR